MGDQEATSGVSLSIEPVQVYDSPAYLPAGILRESKLLDITHSGVATFETQPDSLETKVQRLWAERGDFSKFSTESLRKRKASPGSSSPGDEEAMEETQSEQVKGGTIGEGEFAALRDEVLGRLDMAHFSSIHAHQLLGMLLKSHAHHKEQQQQLHLRAASPAVSTTSAAQSKRDDFVLDPLSIGLSRITIPDAQGDEEEEVVDETARAIRELHTSAVSPEQKLHDLKVSLAQKRASLFSAADLLRQGAAELRASHAPERERWRGLREIKQRGWRLTPGRPLLDLERFDVDKEEDGGLRGFGTPILSSDGKVREEGARDAWIGYGIPEVDVQTRRNTLAYWAAEPGGDKLVFPDRPGRRLRTRFVLHQDEEQTTWTSDDPSPPPAPEGLDATLQCAQSEMQDESTFRDILHQSRAVGSGTRILSPTSLAIEVTPQLDLSFELVPRDAEREGTYSPFAKLVLAFARFAPLRTFLGRKEAESQARAGDVYAKTQVLRAKNLAAPKKETNSVERLHVLGPLLSFVHYASFLHRLRMVLEESVEKSGGKASFALTPLTLGQEWLDDLVERATNYKVVGQATVTVSNCVVATASLSSPSGLLVQFPRKKTPQGTGVTLALDLPTFAELLEREVEKMASK